MKKQMEKLFLSRMKNFSVVNFERMMKMTMFVKNDDRKFFRKNTAARIIIVSYKRSIYIKTRVESIFKIMRNVK